MPQRRFDPMPETASEVALDQALRPFIERFVSADKRTHAASVYLPNKTRHEWRGLISMIDRQRGRTFEDTELVPWHAVRGVFLVDKDAYSVDTRTAMGLYVKDEAMFVAYGSTFAVALGTGGRLLLT
jgi:hypothetical protein